MNRFNSNPATQEQRAGATAQSNTSTGDETIFGRGINAIRRISQRVMEFGFGYGGTQHHQTANRIRSATRSDPEPAQSSTSFQRVTPLDADSCSALFDCQLFKLPLAIASCNQNKAGTVSVSGHSVRSNTLDELYARYAELDSVYSVLNCFPRSLNFDTFYATTTASGARAFQQGGRYSSRVNLGWTMSQHLCSCTYTRRNSPDKATFYGTMAIYTPDNINLQNSDGNTPLHILATLRELVLNAQHCPGGGPALYGYFCDFMIENGANVTIQNKNEETALDIAMSHDNPDFVKRLIHSDSLLPINAKNICFFLLFVERHKNYLSADSQSHYNLENPTFHRILELAIFYSIEQALTQGDFTREQLSDCFNMVDAKVKELNETSLVNPFSLPLILDSFRQELHIHSIKSPETLKSISKRSLRKRLQEKNLTLKKNCTRVCKLDLPNNLKAYVLGIRETELKLLDKMFELYFELFYNKDAP